MLSGEEIKVLRENAGYTVYAAGIMSGVDRSVILRIESGERSPSAETLAKLLAAYGVTVTFMQVRPRRRRPGRPGPKRGSKRRKQAAAVATEQSHTEQPNTEHSNTEQPLQENLEKSTD